MPLTVQDAYSQLKERISQLGGWNAANLFDGVIGVGQANVVELQDMLNKLLQKKGILGPEDEKVFNDLIAKSEQEKKRRQKIRTRYGLYAVGAILVIGGIGYVTYRASKK